MKKKLLIFGNGKQSKCTANILRLEGIETFGFFVDAEYIVEKTLSDKPVFSTDEVKKFNPSEYILFLPLSWRKRCRLRKDRFLEFDDLGFEFFTFISKAAVVYTDRKNIGKNVYIGATAMIQPDVVLDDNCYVAEGVQIGHDVRVKKHCFIGSNAVITGSCQLDERVTIGAGAVLKQDLHITEGVFVGMGISVHENIEKAGVYVFSPLEEKHHTLHK